MVLVISFSGSLSIISCCNIVGLIDVMMGDLEEIMNS